MPSARYSIARRSQRSCLLPPNTVGVVRDPVLIEVVASELQSSKKSFSVAVEEQAYSRLTRPTRSAQDQQHTGSFIICAVVRSDSSRILAQPRVDGAALKIEPSTVGLTV